MYGLLRLLIILAVFLLLVVGFFHPIYAITQDLGRHILTGNIILETGSVPKTNLFSYTYPTYPFINHHYLSEVIYALLFQITGYTGLLLTTVLLAVSAFGLVFFTALKKNSLLAVGVASLLYLPILFERTDVRPEIFSFFFLAAFATILYCYRERFTRWIYILIPLELVWVNTHIYFIVGLLVLGLFFLDELLTHRKNLKQKHTRILFLVLIASCLVTLLNPNGIQGALYPLSVFHNYGYTIEENQTIFLLERLGFHKPAVFYFKLSVLLLFTSLFISLKRTRPVDWLLATTFTALGFLMVRNLPLFVFATFIPCAYAVTHAFAKVTHLFRNKTAIIHHVAILFVIIAIIWQIKTIAGMHTLSAAVPSGARAAADFFLKNNLHGPVFNNFDIGSYLEYRLYPEEKVFVDGRPEAYPASFFTDVYMPMQENPAVFSAADKKYGFNAIFFAHTDQTPWAGKFLQHITTNLSWKPVYFDSTIIIFLKNTPQNQRLITKFGMDLQTIQPTHKTNDFSDLLQLASFYNRTGLAEQEEQIYQNILAIKPEYCPALYNLTILLMRRQDPAAGAYQGKHEYTCR